MTHLQRAIDLAVAAHRKMEDPPGEPYILHPMRVMQRFDDHELMAVAILHDTMERAGVTKDQLEDAGIDPAIIKAVQLLTHDATTSYADYVIRLQSNRLAKAVKIADLMDNADLRYVDMRADKQKKDRRRVVRYALSYKYLAGQMKKSDYRRLMKHAEN